MSDFSLSKKSVKAIIAGLVLMVSGYILLIGGSSDSTTVFNPAMFNVQRMVISPLLTVLGIVIVITAIIRKPKEEE